MKKILYGLLVIFLLIMIISAVSCAHSSPQNVYTPSSELKVKIASLEELKKQTFPSMGSEEFKAFYGKDLDEFTKDYSQLNIKGEDSPFSKDVKKIEFYQECIRKNKTIDQQAEKLKEQYHTPYQNLYNKPLEGGSNFMAMVVYLREKLFQASIFMAQKKPSEAMDVYMEHLRLCSLNVGTSEICDLIVVNNASDCLEHMNLPLLLSYEKLDAHKRLDQLNELAMKFSDEVFQFSYNYVLLNFDKAMKSPSDQSGQEAFTYGLFIEKLAKDYEQNQDHYKLPETRKWLDELNAQFGGDFALMNATGEFTEFYQYLGKWGVLKKLKKNVREMVQSELYFNKDTELWSLKEQHLLSSEARASLHILEGDPFFPGMDKGSKKRELQRQFDMVRLALSTRIYLDKQGELPQSPEVLIDKKMVAPLICQNEKYDYVSYYEETNDPVATDQLLLDNILVKLPYLTFSHNPCFSFGYNETLKQSTVSYTFAEFPVAQKIADSMFFYSGWFKRIDSRKDILLQEYAFIRPKKALCIFAYGEDGDSDGGLRIAKPNPCVIYSSAVEDGDVILPVIMK